MIHPLHLQLSGRLNQSVGEAASCLSDFGSFGRVESSAGQSSRVVSCRESFRLIPRADRKRKAEAGARRRRW